MELLPRLLILKWHPKIKNFFVKNCHAMFEKKMKFNCHDLELDDDDLFKNSSKRPTFDPNRNEKKLLQK